MLVALFEHLPLWLKSKVCGYLAPGHSYTMEMIRGDGAGYVLDPFTSCRHCGMGLPENVFKKLLITIEDDDMAEDDLW